MWVISYPIVERVPPIGPSDLFAPTEVTRFVRRILPVQRPFIGKIVEILFMRGGALFTTVKLKI